MLVHEEAPVLVLFDGWLSFFRDKVVPWRIGMAEQLRERLEVEVLPKFIEAQRWYAEQGEAVRSATVKDHVVWDAGRLSWLLSFLTVRDALYFLPLALGWEEDEDQLRALSALAVARVRQQANVGVMADALADEAFCRHVVKAIGEKRTMPTANGTLRFTPTSKFAELAGEEVVSLTMGALHTQSTNTSVTLGERLFLKCFRRIRPGMHPELEVGRFLTEVAHFKNCVPLAGAVEYVPSGGGESAAVALLQAYIPNQGDAWSYTLAYLERVVESLREDETHGAYLTLIQTLATRTAELHRAFAMKSGDAAFEPEALTAQDIDAWRARVRQEAEQTLKLVEKHDKAKAVAAQKAKIIAFIEAYAAAMKGSGVYDTFDDMRGLLQLAEMEKVLYELRYEAANRPDWIHIPVQGLMSLLEGA